jgi:hypothetical protein
MRQIFWIAGCSAVTLGFAAAVGGMLLRQKKRLNLTYHEALHAESTGQYDAAIALYQSILDRSGGKALDERTRAQIMQRISTIRYQQGYLSQFSTDKKLPSAGVIPIERRVVP